MDNLRLEYARKKQNKSRSHMGILIGKCEQTYAKKERGEVKFTPEEIAVVSKELEFTRDEVSDIFFDGNLPKR